MIRALFRLMSMVALAVAVIMAVLDATRSVALDAVVMTPLGQSWASLSPSTLERLDQLVAESLPAFFHDPVLTGLLELPGFAVFAGLALIAGLLGRRPARRAGRLAPQR